MRIEAGELLSSVIKIVTAVGDRIYRSAPGKKNIRYKGEIDLVTCFDHRAQQALIKALRRRYPDVGVLSEERISIPPVGSNRWIIDPLDGTTNFAHNLPIWCLALALEENRQISLGVVYDPTRRELFWAIRGRGAYLNGRRIKVSHTRRLDRSLLVTGFPYDIRRSQLNNLEYFCRFARQAQAVRRLGSAALDLCYTACGRFDGYWELKLSPWDQAAGSLIVQEAGGKITDFNGNPFDYYGQEVLASNGYIHKAMQRIIQLRLTGRDFTRE